MVAAYVGLLLGYIVMNNKVRQKKIRTLCWRFMTQLGFVCCRYVTVLSS